MSEKRVKHIVAPSGDWFKIQIERIDAEKKYMIMSRVLAWAVMSYEPAQEDRITDSIEGVDTNGYANSDDDLDYYFVYGDDMAPNGKSWLTVFNETPSFNWGLKDISALADKLDSCAKLVLGECDNTPDPE